MNLSPGARAGIVIAIGVITVVASIVDVMKWWTLGIAAGSVLVAVGVLSDVDKDEGGDL